MSITELQVCSYETKGHCTWDHFRYTSSNILLISRLRKHKYLGKIQIFSFCLFDLLCIFRNVASSSAQPVKAIFLSHALIYDSATKATHFTFTVQRQTNCCAKVVSVTELPCFKSSKNNHKLKVSELFLIMDYCLVCSSTWFSSWFCGFLSPPKITLLSGYPDILTSYLL